MEVSFKSLLHLQIICAKECSNYLSNFGCCQKFLPIIIAFLLGKRNIIKETFATEKLYLNSTGEKSQFISVIFLKDLIQYVSSIVKDLEKTRNYGLKVLMKISGFCSQTTKDGST